MPLYPEINLPTLITPQTSSIKKNFVAPSFDFNFGDFVIDSSGRPIMADTQESFCQWCIKVATTERGTRLAYSDDYGVEIEAATKFNNLAAVKSMLIKTLTEAILQHPRAEYVKNFSFEISGDEVRVSFDVKSDISDEERRLSVKL